MSSLKIIEKPAPARKVWMARTATLLRCGLVVLLAIAVRCAAERREPSAQGGTQTVALTLSDVITLAPTPKIVASIGEPTASGLQSVIDADGEAIAYACQTLPAAENVVGYRGPSNVLLMLDKESTVTGARLLFSRDTPDHVAAVESDADFFAQFQGWKLGDPSSFTDVDATTGATLTALAIAEAIAVRLGSEKPSLRFPDDLNADDVAKMFGSDAVLSLQTDSNVEATVKDESGQTVGHLVRTGPLVDSIAGYQGPSELLIATDPDGNVINLRLRNTFDNEPYAGYLNEDDYFWKIFRNKRLADLRSIDLEAEQIEGVSGATMTSLAVAETIVDAAKVLHERHKAKASEQQKQQLHWRRHDTGSALVLMGAILIGTTRLRGVRWLQITWLFVLVGYFGLMTGNLVSLAVLTGWAARGVAWRLAPGLFAVVAVSLILPPTTKRNLYCSHICPHGAAQQLLKRLRLPRWRPNARLMKCLKFVPGTLLLAAILLTLLRSDGNLSAWEPFDAWIWYVAGTTSIAFGLLSLAISAVLPMAYCRFGCPTGRLLDYLRHSARASRLTIPDVALLAITSIAWCSVLS